MNEKIKMTKRTKQSTKEPAHLERIMFLNHTSVPDKLISSLTLSNENTDYILMINEGIPYRLIKYGTNELSWQKIFNENGDNTLSSNSDDFAFPIGVDRIDSAIKSCLYEFRKNSKFYVLNHRAYLEFLKRYISDSLLKERKMYIDFDSMYLEMMLND